MQRPVQAASQQTLCEQIPVSHWAFAEQSPPRGVFTTFATHLSVAGSHICELWQSALDVQRAKHAASTEQTPPLPHVSHFPSQARLQQMKFLQAPFAHCAFVVQLPPSAMGLTHRLPTHSLPATQAVVTVATVQEVLQLPLTHRKPSSQLTAAPATHMRLVLQTWLCNLVPSTHTGVPQLAPAGLAGIQEPAPLHVCAPQAPVPPGHDPAFAAPAGELQQLPRWPSILQL